MAVQCKQMLSVLSATESVVILSAVNGPEYRDGWPVVEQLLGDLPSNHLQSHSRVKYIGDTIYNSESATWRSRYSVRMK